MWRIASVTENVFAPLPAERAQTQVSTGQASQGVFGLGRRTGRVERVSVVTCDQTETGLDHVLVQGNVLPPQDRRWAVRPKGKLVRRFKHRTFRSCSEVRTKARCVCERGVLMRG